MSDSLPVVSSSCYVQYDLIRPLCSALLCSCVYWCLWDTVCRAINHTSLPSCCSLCLRVNISKCHLGFVLSGSKRTADKRDTALSEHLYIHWRVIEADVNKRRVTLDVSRPRLMTLNSLRTHSNWLWRTMGAKYRCWLYNRPVPELAYLWITSRPNLWSNMPRDGCWRRR